MGQLFFHKEYIYEIDVKVSAFKCGKKCNTGFIQKLCYSKEYISDTVENLFQILVSNTVLLN